MSFMQKLGFTDITNVFEKCINATSTLQRDNYMQKFFSKILELQVKYKNECPNGNASLFPLMRIILATEEHERAYGVQEKRLRQLLIKSFGIAGSNAKAIEECNEEDIADVVYGIVKSSKKSELSVADVDDALNELAKNHKSNDQKHQFEKLFLKGSPCCLKWLVKIILKNMKLKISPGKILEKIHPLGGKLFSKYNHLSSVIEFIETGKAAEAMKDEVKPFIPIRAMLSQKFAKDMNGVLERFELYQEVKMDGERFQLHMDKGEFKYFSRNAHDFSDTFNNLISPLIKFKVVVHSVILDGEMIVWNKNLKRFVTKGETDIDVKRLKDIEYHLRPCYCAFDILYLNGVSLIDRPFSHRYEVLHSLFDDRVGVLIKTQPVRIRDVDHLVALFNDALNKKEEGIILKKAESTYMPGERERGGWYKMKADYFGDGVVKEFDCVVIGGFFQNAHTRDYIQKYMLGAIEKQNDGTYNVYSIGEVVTGITDKERMLLHDKLILSAVPYCGTNVIEFEKGNIYFGTNRPDVIIPPHKSIVLQIRTSELAPSSEYFTEYTFRFQRIDLIRNDKFWDESCTLREFQEMFKPDSGYADGQVVKVNKRNVQRSDILSPQKKKQRVLTTKSRAIENFCLDSQEDIEPLDDVLNEHEFCVLSTSSHLPSKRELKALLKLHGALLTEFPRKKKTFAVVAGDIEQQIKIYIAEKSHSVIKAEWLVKYLTKDTPLDDFPKLQPLDFHFMTDELYDENFKQEYDRYGDSYYEPLENVDQLKEIMNNMNVDYKISTDEIMELESEIFTGEEKFKFKLFRGYKGKFIESKTFNMLMQWSEEVFQFRGGEVTSSAADPLIFVDRKTFNIREHPELRNSTIVDYNFIIKSSEDDEVKDMCLFSVEKV